MAGYCRETSVKTVAFLGALFLSRPPFRKGTTISYAFSLSFIREMNSAFLEPPNRGKNSPNKLNILERRNSWSMMNLMKMKLRYKDRIFSNDFHSKCVSICKALQACKKKKINKTVAMKNCCEKCISNISYLEIIN